MTCDYNKENASDALQRHCGGTDDIDASMWLLK